MGGAGISQIWISLRSSRSRYCQVCGIVGRGAIHILVCWVGSVYGRGANKVNRVIFTRVDLRISTPDFIAI